MEELNKYHYYNRSMNAAKAKFLKNLLDNVSKYTWEKEKDCDGRVVRYRTQIGDIKICVSVQITGMFPHNFLIILTPPYISDCTYLIDSGEYPIVDDIIEQVICCAENPEDVALWESMNKQCFGE